MIFIDNIDIGLIEILQKNGRTPFSRIAKKLNIGFDTVLRRYKKLLDLGILETPTVLLNSRLCGFEGLVDFLIELKPGTDPENVRSKVSNMESIGISAIALGNSDLYLSFYFKSFPDFIRISKKLGQIKEVASIEPLLYPSQDWTIPIIEKQNIVEPSEDTTIVRALFKEYEPTKSDQR